jgi:hypothetical protein
MTVKHPIETTIAKPARIVITGNKVRVHAGEWPILGGAIAIKEATFDLLSDDNYIYVDPLGEIVVSDIPIPYGKGLGGEGHPMVDVLVWRQSDGLHVKELTHAD